MRTDVEIDPGIERLAALIRIPTVSLASGGEAAAFDRLLETMASQWPRVHSLDVTRVGGHGLLIHWRGLSAERPVVLMAHLDVVPVVADEWSRDPFCGEVVDGELWGRGTLDDKGSVAGICEAVESLLVDGFVPAYDVWLSFGCDEETTGAAARAAVTELRARGVSPWLVLDEGGAIAHEALPGLAAPIGVVGVSEKGTTAVRLSVASEGGHASTPARGGPAATLAAALVAVDGVRMPAYLHPVTVELFRRVGPHVSGPLKTAAGVIGRLGGHVGASATAQEAGRARRGPGRMAGAALDRTRSTAARALTLAGPEAAALVRTTVALTTLEGSPAINVLPSRVRAGINLRVMVGDTVAEVVERLRRAISDDSVEIEVVDANEASPVSRWEDDAAFALMESAIQEVYPDAVPAPYVMLAATDSRFFTQICERVYRFAPFRMTRSQRASIHAADERIGVDDYLAGVRWYRLLIHRLEEVA